MPYRDPWGSSGLVAWQARPSAQGRRESRRDGKTCARGRLQFTPFERFQALVMLSRQRGGGVGISSAS